MTDWTQRAVTGAGAAMVGGEAMGGGNPLAGLLSDGSDGLLSGA